MTRADMQHPAGVMDAPARSSPNGFFPSLIGRLMPLHSCVTRAQKQHDVRERDVERVAYVLQSTIEHLRVHDSMAWHARMPTRHLIPSKLRHGYGVKCSWPMAEATRKRFIDAGVERAGTRGESGNLRMTENDRPADQAGSTPQHRILPFVDVI